MAGDANLDTDAATCAGFSYREKCTSAYYPYQVLAYGSPLTCVTLHRSIIGLPRTVWLPVQPLGTIVESAVLDDQCMVERAIHDTPLLVLSCQQDQVAGQAPAGDVVRASIRGHG